MLRRRSVPVQMRASPGADVILVEARLSYEGRLTFYVFDRVAVAPPHSCSSEGTASVPRWMPCAQWNNLRTRLGI